MKPLPSVRSPSSAILGIFDGAHDAGACVVAGGRILAAVNEERLTRVKLQNGMPLRSVAEVLHLSGVRARDIEAVAFGSTLTPQIYLRALRFAQKRLKLEEGYFFTAHPTLLQRLTDYVQFASSITAMRSDSFLARAEVAALNLLLRKDLPAAVRWKPIRIVDHHLAHAAAAHFTSGQRATLCITADGVGDGHSMTVCECRGRDIQRLWQIGPHQSFAWFYALITIYLGFMPYRHEGKVVGLAGHGDPAKVRVPFPFAVNGADVRYAWRFGLAAREFLAQLDGHSREDVAAWLQAGTERCVTAVVRHWLQKTGLCDVTLAGGLFANVKLN
ncbi:MAG: hypothetical protein FJ278_10840, partial [Planctomycetes bacterium]|nr:hypothetical protein [Planctomycetota bacterium]